MCSSATHAAAVGEHQSTTWAASVPMDDLAHAIKVAVGAQPVRQLPPPALLKQTEQQQQQQACCASPAATAAPALSSSPTAQGISGSSQTSRLDTLQLQAPLPTRRPTMAEVKAASPCCESQPELCRLDSSSSSSSRGSVCTQLLAQQRWNTPVAEPSSPVYFDDMDDVSHEGLITALSSSTTTSSSSNASSEQEGAVAYLAVSSTGGCEPTWGNISKQQLQQQQQLLCKIWTELQLPVQHEDDDCNMQQEQQQQLSPDSVLLLDAAAATAANASATTSCCSSVLEIHPATGSKAFGIASPRSSLDSSCSTNSLAAAAAAAAAAQASCCSSPASSTYAESCSSTRSRSSSKGRQRRVSWGGDTVYYLPPAEKGFWDAVLSFVPDSIARTRSERQIVLAAAAAAGLAVTAAGAAAIACCRRRV